MKVSEVKIGRTYRHLLDGKWWIVRVDSIDVPDDNNGRSIWNGSYVDNNERTYCCWGFVSELRPID